MPLIESIMAFDRVVEPGFGALHYYAFAFMRAAELVAKSIRQLEAGKTGEPQSGDGSYQSWSFCQAVCLFHRAGKRLISSLAGYWRLLRSGVIAD